MFNLSVRSRLGLYVLVELAREPDRQRSSEDLAVSLEVSVNHLAKVMQALGRAGWISGTRGPSGGYRLVIESAVISMADVVELFEGSPALETCGLSDGRSCKRHLHCEIRNIFQEVEVQAYFTLKSVTIEMLAHPRRAGAPPSTTVLPVAGDTM